MFTKRGQTDEFFFIGYITLEDTSYVFHECKNWHQNIVQNKSYDKKHKHKAFQFINAITADRAKRMGHPVHKYSLN